MCNGKLTTAPVRKGSDAMPEGCGFVCRDKHPTCAVLAQAGACTEEGKAVRYTCAASCGVCKALGMPDRTAEEWPLQPCIKEDGPSCRAWAAGVECVKNNGYMREHCGTGEE